MNTEEAIHYPWEGDLSHYDDGPLVGTDAAAYPATVVAYTTGLPPQPRTLLPGYDSGVLCLLIGIFLLLSYNFRHYSTFLKNFITDLVSTRRREGTFEVRTFSEAGVLISVVLVACLSEGIIVNAALTRSVGDALLPGVFVVIGVVTVVAVVYYLWQLCAYTVVGYVFTDRVAARMWIKGFNASQTLLAFMLVIPALIVLFNPGAAGVVEAIALTAYVLTRLIFIYKGFRLFYDNFGSLLYFILYLCTLEIVPIMVLYRLATMAITVPFDTLTN